MTKLETIDKYVARLLMISFFLPMIVQVQVTAAASLYFVFRVFLAKQQVPSRNYLLALLISATFFLYVFAIPFTPHEYKTFLYILCQRMVSVLFMPLVFAIITPAFGEVIRRELVYFVYACLISCFIGNGVFIYHNWIGPVAAHSLSHVDYRLFFEHATAVHPTYMGMYLCFSICILMFSNTDGKPKTRFINYLLIYALVAFLLSLLAKSPLIALILICVHYAYLNRKTLYRYWLLFIGLFLSVGGVYYFIPFFGQRMREMFSFFGHGKEGNIADNSFYFRELIWSEDTAMLRENWLFGVGPGRMLHSLHERYFFYSLAHQFPVGYPDPHNEYFSQWLCFGLAGVVVLAVILCVHFIKSIRAKDYLYLYLLLILAITFFTETVLARQRGVIFYAVFTSFFFFYNVHAAKNKQAV